jgi:CRISPR-associated endonuclease/helicase Cas3
MSEIVYANSQKQPLDQHLFAVGVVAAELINQLVDESESKKLKQAAFIAGCLHDIGKLDYEFRSWLEGVISKNKKQIIMQQEDGLHIDKAKFSFEKHPRHNEISLWMAQFLGLSSQGFNTKQIEFIEHAVYWHHAKPIRKEEYQNFNDIQRKLKSAYKNEGLKSLMYDVKQVLTSVVELTENYQETLPIKWKKLAPYYDDDVASGFRKLALPEYKQYDLEDDIQDYVDQVTLNSKFNIIRASLISADRLVSALSAEQLQQYINEGSLIKLINSSAQSDNHLIQAISDCLTSFDKTYPNSNRNKKQSIIANELLEVESVAVLNGPAGCGKTKIALEWGKLGGAQKIIWICPRVQVCEGLLNDLTSEEYLPKSKVEICTGELKYSLKNGEQTNTQEGNEFSGDIVLTTIDQVMNCITSHNKVTGLIDFMHSHVVFDEYHEYIPMAGFNLLFAELVNAKKLRGVQANTLLVSATPNFSFVEKVLEIDTDDIKNMTSFNDSQYRFSFQPFDETQKNHTNPLFSPVAENSIVISNTATTAQQAFIHNLTRENAVLFHGKFKVSDKKSLFETIFSNFKKDGLKDVAVLRSGPIVQASLNITCDHMVTEFTLAENWLQRLGRLDRFGENDCVNEYVTAVPSEIIESNGKIKGNCARFLNGSHSYRSAFAWYEFLQDQCDAEQVYSIIAIYQLYYDFYHSIKGSEAVEQDLLASLKKSVEVIDKKVHDPIRFIKPKKSSDKKKLKKSSLRGDSRFVQMATLAMKSSQTFEILNQYAVNWQEQDEGFENCYTESLDIIRNSGILDYVAQKHGRIEQVKLIGGIPASKAHLRKKVLEGAAVNPETPIYLSYTPEQLEMNLGEASPETNAIYYVESKKQVVGAMSLEKLIEITQSN